MIKILFSALVGGANKRKKFIINYRFPEGLSDKILARYPELSKKKLSDVLQKLKMFFEMNRAYGNNNETVAMPSRVVDVAWHEFILYTVEYHKFCHKGFGQYFHHSPFSEKTTPEDAKLSLQRAWVYACKSEYIDPEDPCRLPMLFSLDSKLNIQKGNSFKIGKFKKSFTCVKGTFVGLGAIELVGRVGRHGCVGRDSDPGRGGDGGGGGGGGGCGGGGG